MSSTPTDAVGPFAQNNKKYANEPEFSFSAKKHN